MSEDTQPRKQVQTLVRAFSIIEALTDHAELGVSEIAEAVSLDKSTVYRILKTLKSLGYIDQNPRTSKYLNGLKFFKIGNAVIQHTGLDQIASPAMHKLSTRTGESVNLAVLAGHSVMYIYKIESSLPLQIHLPLGSLFPLYCTGLGKVLLANLPEEKLDRLLSESAEHPTPRGLRQFKAYTENTITDETTLREELALIREKGYGVDNQEQFRGISCLAAPIFNHTNEVIAALSITLPHITGINIQMKIEAVLPFLLEATREISKTLGSTRVDKPQTGYTGWFV